MYAILENGGKQYRVCEGDVIFLEKIQAQPGEVVLLSPGGTSYDAFKDFEERGQFFRDWVNQL